jgi:hypothetical protein
MFPPLTRPCTGLEDNKSVAQRLVEEYKLSEPVEIYLRTVRGQEWKPGQIIQLAHPGVWVETGEGARWFVTNSRRIRKVLPNA